MTISASIMELAVPVADPVPSLVVHEESRAVSGLRRRRGDGAAPGDALVGCQRSAVLHVLHEQLERSLSVRLDELELWEHVLERLDVVAVLDFVQPIGGTSSVVIVVAIIMAAPGQRRRDAARIGPRVVID